MEFVLLQFLIEILQPVLDFFIGSGSRNENTHIFGSSYLFKTCGLKITNYITKSGLSRSIENISPSFCIQPERESLSFSGEVQTENVSSFVKILQDIVVSPNLIYHEIEEAKEEATEIIKKISSDSKHQLFESLYREAYRGKGLGHPLVAPTYNLHHLSQNTLKTFVNDHFFAQNMVLVSVGGVSHEEFTSIAAKTFGTVKGGTKATLEPSKYIGGYSTTHNNSDTHIALAFEGASVSSPDYFSFEVLKHILGSARQQIEPIGQGKSGRLNRIFLQPNPWISEASTFNFSHSDSGLFGIIATATPGRVPELMQSLTSTLKSLSQTPPTNDQIQRAINLIKANAHSSSKSSVFYAVGNGVLTTKKATTPSESVVSLQSVNAQSIQRIIHKVLHSKPTVVALGDVYGLPTNEEISAALH